MRRLLLALAGGSGGFIPEDEVANLGWTSVKAYGATGDGTTNDTAAIDAAIAALPADGGVLYFPPGDYLTTGGHELDTPCVVLGAGGGGGLTLDYQPSDLTIPHITRIKCASTTASVFTRSTTVHYKSLCILNTSGGTPSAGAGCNAVSSGGNVSGSYEDVTIHGFHTNIRELYGRDLTVDRCHLLDAVDNNLAFEGLDTPDVGWLHVTNSFFYQTTRDGVNHIWIGGGGGIKITGNWFAGAGSLNQIVDNGIWLDVQASTQTSDLLIANNHFENMAVNCIKGTTQATSSTWRFIMIQGNHLAPYQTGSTYAIDFVADGQYDFRNISIVGNQMYGYRPSGGNSPYAVRLTNVQDAVLVGNHYIGYATGFSSLSGTNNIHEAENVAGTA